MNKEIALALYEIGAVKFGKFIFKSGIESPNYMDLRLLISYPKVLNQFAEAMTLKAKSLKFDRIAGIPYAALPIATAISIKTGWPMIYARKEVKEYGTKKKLEGIYKEGETALIIDDVITTGESKFETIEPFEAAGLKVKDVLVLIDREQGGRKMLNQKGYQLHSVIGINEILDILKEEGKIDENLYQTNKEFIAKTQV